MATAGRTTKLDDDFTVSALGFGAGALAVYGDADDAESLATLNRCLDWPLLSGASTRALWRILKARRGRMRAAPRSATTVRARSGRRRSGDRTRPSWPA